MDHPIIALDYTQIQREPVLIFLSMTLYLMCLGINDGVDIMKFYDRGVINYL